LAVKTASAVAYIVLVWVLNSSPTATKDVAVKDVRMTKDVNG